MTQAPALFDVDLVDLEGNRFAATIEVLPTDPAAASAIAEDLRLAGEWADPAIWIPLPNGNRIHRDQLGPCGDCGGTTFLVAAHELAMLGRCYCPDCDARERARSWRRAEEQAGRIVGWIDMRTGAVGRGLPPSPAR